MAMIQDEGLRQATELQIAHFGQCPMQLFVRPHVRRTLQVSNIRQMTFYQMLSAYSQGTGIYNQHPDGSPRLFGEPICLPFFSSPKSHTVHLEAPPPGPHAPLIGVRLAGIDRCLAVDANGIFHSFRWAWKPDPLESYADKGEEEEDEAQIDKGCFVAQRELPRFRTVPRLIHIPTAKSSGVSIPAVSISKTLFASRSVLLVLSDADGRGGLGYATCRPGQSIRKGGSNRPSCPLSQDKLHRYGSDRNSRGAWWSRR